MAESNSSGSADKPCKPYADFPLFPHATKRWAKKIRGKLHYFGPWADPKASLDKYLAEKDFLYAGRKPAEDSGGLTVRDLCNRFLTTKRRLLARGEIATRTFQEYHNVCKRIIDVFGKTRMVEDLAADEFERLRATMAKTLGSVSLGNEIGRVRMVFKYADDRGLIERRVRYGQGFKRPSRKTLRKAKATNGPRMFEAAELRRIIDTASQPLRAMALLGVNCGFGQTDVSRLPQSAIDLEVGWVDYARPKTGIRRRCPLWPETVEAVLEAIVRRPAPKEAGDAELVFLTHLGNRWVRLNKQGTPNDEIGKQFAKLLRGLKLKRKGVSFYALRHTFETIGGEARDQVAVDHIMGHARDNMASVYRERIWDERLRAVTNFVRQWLFGPESSEIIAEQDPHRQG